MILCDLDGTVIAPVPCDGTPEGIAAWERTIIEAPPPPVEGAIEGLRRRMERRGLYSIGFVTARSARLRRASHDWVERHLPGVTFTINMGHAGADSGGRMFKLARLVRLIDSCGSSTVDLFDDDPEMRHALRQFDWFYHAPGCWR